jgi:RNA polymerase sigma factor (sigma-70 family)
MFESDLEQCIGDLNEGEADAAWKLVISYQTRLHDSAHRQLRDFERLRDKEETDDVAQEVSIRLRRAVENAPPRTVHAFKLLAAEVLRRVLLDRSRHFFGPQALASHRDIPGGHTLGHAEPIDETLDLKGMAKWTAFQEQIAALPEPERQIVELRWYRQATLPEVAALLGISVDTCRRRWQRACRKLRDALGDEWPGV